jgi:flavin-dependent dehydrogenase
MMHNDKYILDDGANISVIGGGPTGTFFTIFALKMAKMIDKQLNITIYDPKDFTKQGPGGCNRCGGVISELLVQTLAIEGINLPDTVIQRGINSYKLHTAKGSVDIATPAFEKTIATIKRGGGPKDVEQSGKESFDDFLLKKAVELGAVHEPMRIDRIDRNGDKPHLYCKDRMVHESDAVIGAFGVNTTAAKMFEDFGFGYERPDTITTAIAELEFGEDVVSEYFGNAIQLFLLPVKDLKFAAMVPKGSYVTMIILGKNMNSHTVENLLNHEVVKGVLPKGVEVKPKCRCLPKMSVSTPKIPFTDRIAMCGDAGSTRLFKDGLGAAYLMGKSLAKTVVFDGVSSAHFREGYLPTYRDLKIDNYFGRYLFGITDLYKKYSVMTKGMLAVVQAEQHDPKNPKILSNILWNMFTGNERYKNIFNTAISLPMHLDLWNEFARIILRRGK